MTAIGIAKDSGQDRPSALVIAVRLAIVLVAVAALLSPLYVALRGSSFLNQPPPAFWGVTSATSGSSGTGGAAPAGTSPASTQKTTSGLGGC